MSETSDRTVPTGRKLREDGTLPFVRSGVITYFVALLAGWIPTFFVVRWLADKEAIMSRGALICPGGTTQTPAASCYRLTDAGVEAQRSVHLVLGLIGSWFFWLVVVSICAYLAHKGLASKLKAMDRAAKTKAGLDKIEADKEAARIARLQATDAPPAYGTPGGTPAPADPADANANI